MEDAVFGRLAGEAFSFITGADLAWLDLEREPSEGLDRVPMTIQAIRMSTWTPMTGCRGLTLIGCNPGGLRMERDSPPAPANFVGAPVTRDHCLHVLKTGYQRQRIAAAFHRCLLSPGHRYLNGGPRPGAKSARWPR